MFGVRVCRSPGACAFGAVAMLLFLGLSGPPRAEAQTLTKVRDLFFGYCDGTPGTSYTVLAAENPGPGACQGAYSGRYEIAALPNRRLRVQLAGGGNVTITNGTDSLNVSADSVPAGANICSGAGTLTVYIGGTLAIPATGMVLFGSVSGAGTLNVTYQGGAVC